MQIACDWICSDKQSFRTVNDSLFNSQHPGVYEFLQNCLITLLTYMTACSILDTYCESSTIKAIYPSLFCEHILLLDHDNNVSLQYEHRAISSFFFLIFLIILNQWKIKVNFGLLCYFFSKDSAQMYLA